MTDFYCQKCKINTETSVCPICGERTQNQVKIYWCKSCNIPLINSFSHDHTHELIQISNDIRPVFPEERLLIELILGTPFKYMKSSVWSTLGGTYIIVGKKKRIFRTYEAGRP